VIRTTDEPGPAEDESVDLDVLLDRLDAEQRAAVTAPPGPVAVIAGAGSGKTRVLTTRIAYRIASGTARAPHVVAFTFTRQAADELQRRLARLGVDDSVVAGTFHGVAYRILRRRWEDRGRREVPTLVTNRIDLLTEVVKGDRRTAAMVSTEIEWSRARLVSPDDYAKIAVNSGRRSAIGPEQIAETYRAFETLKRRRRILDFDDLLSECIAELQRPGVAAAVGWWHRHLHVDEFQDINPLQYAFLEALRNGGSDLFVVGDPAQAIYGWNGADPTLLDRIQHSSSAPVVITLATNYRSTPQVVGAGDRVLAANRQPRRHRAARPDGARVVTVQAADEADEARRIVGLAATLRSPGTPWSNVAVLARTHELLRQYAAEFTRAGIPTRTVTRRGALDSRVSRLTREARSAVDADALRAWAIDLALGDEDDDDAPDAETARRILDLVNDFDESGGGNGRAFAAWADLQGASWDTSSDAVELVTMHAAKGREWPVAIVAGIDSVGFPAPSGARAAARAEEVRLLYVALTRAVDRLAVTWCDRRGGRTAGRSPLLPDLDSVPAEPTVDLPVLPRRAAKPAATIEELVHGDLVAWRARAAMASGVPPAFVVDDATLRRIAAKCPIDEESLAAIDGVGALMARRLASRVLPIVTARV
jgi:DNA helicase-2/ATP-dependent DNA helicase PcrA